MKKMAKRKVKDSKKKIINSESIILFFIFLTVAIIFYVSLSNARSDIAGFSIVEIIFSIIFAVFVTGILVWTKNIIMINPYLGSVCGIIAILILEYGFYLRYQGRYSTIFMFVAAIVALIFLGRNFFKYRKSGNINENNE